MPHFKTYCTKRILTDQIHFPRSVWKSALEFCESHPEKLRAVESKIVKTRMDEVDVDVMTNVWLFSGSFKEFIAFTKNLYIQAGLEEYFTPGENGYGISESAIALVPVKAVADNAILKEPIPMPKIRSQLSSRNFLTFCEDDFPDVDIALSNNSFTLPLTEAVKLAEQILRIAKHHGELVSVDQKPNNGSLSECNSTVSVA